MQKFSQGPWSQSATMSSDWGYIRLINDADGNLIAKICHPKEMSQEEALANALIIKTAPQMFRALCDVASMLAEHPDFKIGNSKVHYLAHMANALSQAAIEKAPSVGIPSSNRVTMQRACELIERLRSLLNNWVDIADDEDHREEDDYAIKDADLFLMAASGGNVEQAERYWAITGRKPGDKVDTMHVVRALDRPSAEAAFAERCWDNEVDGVNQRAEICQKHSCENGVYITSIAVSDLPIEVV